jgi:hypothetical protein
LQPGCPTFENQRLSGRGRDDQLRTTVGGIGGSFDVPERFEVVQDPGHRRRCDAFGLSQGSGPLRPVLNQRGQSAESAVPDSGLA